MAHDVFLSHSSADRAMAQTVLEGRPAYLGAGALMALGETERAKEWRANHETKSWIKLDSDFDALRSHHRYQKVVELIG